MPDLYLRLELQRAIRTVAPTFATIMSPEALVGSLINMPELARRELVALLSPPQPQQQSRQGTA